MTDAIDWDHAAQRAGQVTKAGPPIDRQGLRALVASLHQAAADAPSYVADVTGLTAAAEKAADGTVLVVDRPRWSQAATETFRVMLGDAIPAPKVPGASRVLGEQLGWVLGLLSTRILGQFDPYVSSEPGSGRLLLVAPNVLTVQRQLDADDLDFHLWVCLHEQTHAVQFAAAPWLADFLGASLRTIVKAQMTSAGFTDDDATEPDEPAPVGEMDGQAANDGDASSPSSGEPENGQASDDESILSRLVNLLRSGGGGGEVPGLLSVMLPEEHRETLAKAVAVMSLLEGHADVVMDEVGPSAVPTVRSIRESFEKRRDERTLTTMLLRRLLGLDAKLLQYRNGAEFVRGVREKVGHAGLNAVWAGPEQLPTPEEIANPDAWVARVHG